MKKNRKSITLMAHDPGSHNYGIAILRILLPDKKPRPTDILDGLPFSILYAGKLTNSFTTLKDATQASLEVEAYVKEIRRLQTTYQPDLHIGERYMSRRMGGVTIELVNMVLGTLRLIAYQDRIPVKLIPASQWKNELKRREVDLKESYKTAKAANKRTPHEVDAVMIGLYGAFKIMRIKPFNVRDPKGLVGAVLKKLGGTN